MNDNDSDEVLVFEVAPNQSPSEAVVEAVATAAGVDPIASDDGSGAVLDPLYDAVDPDALDAFFGRDDARTGQFEREVRFRYYDHSVAVRDDRRVLVERLEPELDGMSV